MNAYLVDFDSSVNSMFLKYLWERNTIGIFLIESFLKQNNPTDVLGNRGIRPQKQLAVVSSIFFVVIQLDLVESSTNGTSAFICSKNSFAGGGNGFLTFGFSTFSEEKKVIVHTAVAISSASYLPMVLVLVLVLSVVFRIECFEGWGNCK